MQAVGVFSVVVLFVVLAVVDVVVLVVVSACSLLLYHFFWASLLLLLLLLLLFALVLLLVLLGLSWMCFDCCDCVVLFQLACNFADSCVKNKSSKQTLLEGILEG